MDSVLLTAGVVCVIAAVVGGGLQAFGTHVPVVSSVARQALLFVLGVGFLAAAWLLREGADGSGEDVSAYRQRAAAVCERIVTLRQAALPVDAVAASATGLGFNKEPLLRELRRRHGAAAAELTSLWAVSPPEALRDEQATARSTAREWLARFEGQIADLGATAPELLTQSDVEPSDDDAALSARTNEAMTALAGQNCPVAG